MNIEIYKDFLLKSIPGAHEVSGGKEICCTCFECGKKNHLYISIPNTLNEPSKYDCKKCHASGWVTSKKLLYWGIFDPNIATDLINHNKNIKIDTRYNRVAYNIHNNYISEDKLSEFKLIKFNQRLGTNLTYKDLLEKKIVLNLNDLLDSNNIHQYTRDIRIVNSLDESFLGFLSIDNAYINLRRLCKEGKLYKSIDKRYVNYTIYDKIDNSERFYTIPNEIDVITPIRIPLHIAEGPFDILSIYYNLREQNNFGIYSSVSGSNYLGIIRYFLLIIKLSYIEIHLYPDNDIYGSNEVMNNIAEIIYPFQIPLYIHRNTKQGEKDFGVSLNRINEVITKLI